MNDFLVEIKKITDQLAVIGAEITTIEYIEVIFDGLPEEYNPFITSLFSRNDPYSIDEMESLLMSIEERVEKCSKSELNLQQLQNTPMQAHVAQTQQQWQRGGGRGNYNGNFHGGRDSSGRGRGRHGVEEED